MHQNKSKTKTITTSIYELIDSHFKHRIYQSTFFNILSLFNTLVLIHLICLSALPEDNKTVETITNITDYFNVSL